MSKIKQYFDRKRYEIILNDRKHLTDYEKDLLIPDIKERLNILKQYFNDVISLCNIQKDSPVFTQAVQSIVNSAGAQLDPKSPQQPVGELFFEKIKELVKTECINDIDKILGKYKTIQDLKNLGLFLTEVNCLCSSFLAINNKLLLFKIETYPYLIDEKTSQTIPAHPRQYYLTIEPFQITVTNIIAIAKATSDTINEWHKYAIKLKSQYLELYTSRFSRNIHILTIILAIVLSALFLVASDPFNLYKENMKLKRGYQELSNKYTELKNEKSYNNSLQRTAPAVR